MSQPALHIVVHCPACRMAEAFDLQGLACCQRSLPLAAISAKLRCRCGSRQRLRVEYSPEEGARHEPPWAQLWVL